MTALTVAALLLALTGGTLALRYCRQVAQLRLEVETERQRGERAEQTIDRVHADTENALRQLGAQVADAGHVIRRLTAERDETQRQAKLAAKGAMLILAHERDENLASLQAWQQLTFAALLLPPPQPALPAARNTPELLPSGEHALVDGDPALLVQLDGDPLYDGPDPPGVNGQQRTTTRPRTRKKAAQ